MENRFDPELITNTMNMMIQNIRSGKTVALKSLEEINKSMSDDCPEMIKFEYTNYKGITSIRHVVPEGIRFGHTKWHKEDQWLLKAFDLDKNAIREFAVKDIKGWK